MAKDKPFEKIDEIKPKSETSFSRSVDDDKNNYTRLLINEQITKEVTSAPTYKPKTWKEQFVIANLSGTFYLYVYFPTANSWKRVTVS